jgi:tetratricopeptide (TPR) repeat protein
MGNGERCRLLVMRFTFARANRSPDREHQSKGYDMLNSLPVSALLLGLLASIPNTTLDPVTADLAAGRADDAISRLNLSLSAQPADAEAHNLLCRVFYQEQRWDDAIHQCEAAVQLAPSDSEYHLWLGRAYGEKADSIHSIKAYGLAKKVHNEFERAVQLDGKNVDAISDLSEFYTAAPGIVGGGKDKAQALVAVLEPLNPVQADQLKARLAEKDKNYPLAEADFKAAVAASAQPADAWMALASYYSRRKQWDQMLQALHAGIDADAKSAKPHGPALVDGAGILNRSHREPQLATQLLELYLASPNQSADAPAFQVHARLGYLLEQQGDHAGAQQHLEAAAGLAHDYHFIAPKAG